MYCHFQNVLIYIWVLIILKYNRYNTNNIIDSYSVSINVLISVFLIIIIIIYIRRIGCA
jgi:hypothetical protein